MKKVRDARRRSGLTQAEVAKELNIVDTTFNGYETLNRDMGIAALLKLPAILGCKISDLLPDSVLTDYDRARAADPQLTCVVQAWPKLNAAQRHAILVALEAFASSDDE